MSAGADPWARRLLWLLAVLSVARLGFAWAVDLCPDEAYYWAWAQQLAAGYHDHPPAVAWLVRAGTALLGDNELGVRLAAVLCGALAVWLVFVMTRRLTGRPRRAFWVALLAAGAPILAAGSVIHTPDAALMAAWALAAWFALRAFECDRRLDWIGLGAAVGLAVLAKASGLLLVAGLGLFALSCRAGRMRLRGSGPALGLLAAALVAAPNLVWELRHAGGALAFQLDHVTGDAQLRPLGPLEFIGGQLGVVSPLLWAGLVVFLVAGWRSRVRSGRSEAYLLWCLSAPLVGLVAGLSLLGRVEANWPAVAYLAAAPGMAWALGGGIGYLRRRRLWTGLALGLAWVPTLLLHLQALLQVLPLAPEIDPTTRLRGWQRLAERAASAADALDAELAAEGYGPTSELRFYSGRPVRYWPSSSRRSQYDRQPRRPLPERLLFLQPRSTLGPPAPCRGTAERWLLLRPPDAHRPDRSGDFAWWVCSGLEPAAAAAGADDAT